jgi:hypothetical protein
MVFVSFGDRAGHLLLWRNAKRIYMFRLLASDYAILFSLVFCLWLFMRRESSVVRWMLFDKVRWARIASRVAIGSIIAFALWTTVIDNWRQMLGFLVNERDRWRSDPYLYDPPADPLRAMTFILLGAAVLGGAYLYARYARGYLMPIVLTPVALITFYALNSFRMRFELEGPLSERGVNWSDPGQAVMTLIWFAMFYVVMTILIMSAWAILWGPASIVFSIIFRSTIGRERIEEPDIYRALRERSAARQENPRSS